MKKTMLRSKVLSIRAVDRDPIRFTDTDSNFLVRVTKIPKVTRIQIQNAMIPLTFYNINTSNNTINFNDGIARVATLVPGTYTAQQLAANMKIVMDAISTLVYTITINTITQRITISSTANFSLDFTSLISSLSKMLGFTQSLFSGANSYTGSKNLNVNRIYSQINISSENVSRHNEQVVSSNLQDSSLICRINNSIYKPSEYLYFSNDDNSGSKMFNSSIGSIEHIDIKLKDLDGNYFDFNGVNDGIVVNFIITYEY